MFAIDKLIEKIDETGNPSVVGLDTDISYLPPEMLDKCRDLESAARQVTDFNLAIIDRIRGIVPAVKVQVAYYESLGWCGMRAFYDTVTAARDAGLVVISDVKRNDIGSTMSAYSAAHLGKTVVAGKEFEAFPSDFMTVNAYLGSDGINPLIKDCAAHCKGIFVLVKTSNPSSGELQDKILQNGRTVFMEVAHKVAEWGTPLAGKYGYSGVGAVVGATHPDEAAKIRAEFGGMFFLVPGYGAQGGGARDILPCFDRRGMGAIVNNSRGILLAYRNAFKGEPYYKAAGLAASAMRDDLRVVLRK